jgi:hypothetical protein
MKQFIALFKISLWLSIAIGIPIYLGTHIIPGGQFVSIFILSTVTIALVGLSAYAFLKHAFSGGSPMGSSSWFFIWSLAFTIAGIFGTPLQILLQMS